MSKLDLSPGEKLIEEVRQVPLMQTPLFGVLVWVLLLAGLRLGAHIFYGSQSFTRLALELATVLVVLYAVLDYRKKFSESSYLLTDKRLILRGQIRAETLRSFLNSLGSRKETAASIPYSTIAGLKINKTPFFSALLITQNLAGQEPKDTRRDYAMVSIPDPEGTMKKILRFAPWIAPPEASGKDIKK